MEKSDIALLFGVAAFVGVIHVAYKQGKINKAQALIDNQIISASQLFAEKLGIESMPNINIVDAGAGKKS